MNAQIYLRVHARTDQSVRRDALAKPGEERFAPYALVIDTETRLNLRQSLMLGLYRFCEFQNGVYVCLEEGVFYADGLGESRITTLRKFVRSHSAETIVECSKRLRLYSRSQFVEKVFFPACSAGAVVCGYNLCFDISRFSAEYRVARGAGGRAWSFVLSQYKDPKTGQALPNSFRPRIQLIPKDSKAAFIRLAGGDRRQPFRSGRFLDLKTLVWALRNKNLSLDSACREFNVRGKLDHTPGGRISRAEVQYCREDVRATMDLMNALLAEFRQYPLGEMTPESAFSAASLGKTCLKTMGVIRPSEKFRLHDKMLGVFMAGYFGGRAEVRVRQTPLPLVYVDFLSEYPTVNLLLGFWGVLTAEQLQVCEATRSVLSFLNALTPDLLFDPRTWRKLKFFALVEPRGDILPVRTIYGEGSSQTNIGLNPLTSDKPVWYAGPDIVASWLLTGQEVCPVHSRRLEHKAGQGQ